MDVLYVSERRACRALGQYRSTQRKGPRGRDDETALTADLVELARRYRRYGYRKIGARLKAAGGLVNDKRVERIWRREGLKVPARQSKQIRLWDGDGSCLRLWPERRDHVWSYDFVEVRTHDGRRFRILNVVDEFSRECLAIRVARKLKAADVIDVLSDYGYSRSGFHAWLTHQPSQRAGDDEAILGKARTSFVASDRTYGARRVWRDVLAEGVSCGLHRIERIMRENALRARSRRRGLQKDEGERAAASPNLLERRFVADAPNRKWIADFTYIWTAEGWLYVAAVIDLFSRRVVGRSMQASMTAQLVTDALVMAIWRRGK